MSVKTLFARAVTAVMMVAATGANALTSTQTLSFDTSSEQKQTLTGFDTSLGTLTEVSAVLSGQALIDGGSIAGSTSSSPSIGFRHKFVAIVSGDFVVSSVGLTLVDDNLFGPLATCDTDFARERCDADYRSDSHTFRDSDSTSNTSPYEDTDVEFTMSVRPLILPYQGTDIERPSTNWLLGQAWL